MVIPQITVLFQSLADNLLQLRWECRIGLDRGRWLMMEDGIEDNRRCRAGERLPAGGHFVEHGTKTEQIGASIQFFPSRLLGGHVRNCSVLVPCSTKWPPAGRRSPARQRRLSSMPSSI